MGLPPSLIFQNMSVGLGTLALRAASLLSPRFPENFVPHHKMGQNFPATYAGLPRLHRADPSTSLDKSILFSCGCHYTRFTLSCQVELDNNF